VYPPGITTRTDGSIFSDQLRGDVPDLYRNEGDGAFTFRTFAQTGSNLKYLGWAEAFSIMTTMVGRDIFIANGHVYPELENHHHPESQYRQRNLTVSTTPERRFDDVTSVVGPGFDLRRSGRGVAFGASTTMAGWIFSSQPERSAHAFGQ